LTRHVETKSPARAVLKALAEGQKIGEKPLHTGKKIKKDDPFYAGYRRINSASWERK
jgi:hypothetical protein